ncbi:hypothetical protein PPROV_000197700 [Pycnococcus provasolii]|uniref:Uncharacterized protein n=1 Tax=Pycnococcus provasolii TaxID=41880 RepID=A0A830H9D9_9CHLO|nr:hypothetical protein PPROV_000197700 [Pycnococcus provasolii]
MSPWHLARSLVKDVESGVEDEDEDEDEDADEEQNDTHKDDVTTRPKRRQEEQSKEGNAPPRSH